MNSSVSRSLAQWLSRIEAGHPTEIELGLDRICKVADRLQLRDGWSCPVVTLAGTNGKGSTQAYLETILTRQGYRVAAYSSPHLLRYNERVRLNHQPVDDRQLCQAFEAVDLARSELGISLSYFEFGTLAALWIFRRWQPDVMLLEIGLGGRLDAVNIIDPDISVITTVALDHQDWLGDDREQVGFEKAGILRVGKPLVYGETDMPASVCERAELLECPVFHWGRDFGPENRADQCWNWTGGQQRELTYTGLPKPQLPFENASTALQVLSLLPLKLDTDVLKQGLAEAQLAGRRQRVDWQGRELLLDVAHNPHAAEYLVDQLPPSVGQTWAVIGMLADKDLASTLAPLQPVVDHWMLCDLDVPRGAKAQQLQQVLPQESTGQLFGSPWQACQAALAQSQPNDRILVVGSFFTVADILQQLETES